MSIFLKTLLIISLLLNLNTKCLYFQLQEGKEKCFYEDTIYYEFYDQLSEQKYDQNAGIRVYVRDDDDELVYQNLLTQREGKFLLFSKDSRYLKFCYRTTTSHWITQNEIIRFKIKIVQQQQQERQDSIANSTKLQDLVQLVKSHESLDGQTNLYQNKINQEGEMNQKLIEKNEEIINKINFWTILQTFTLIISVAIQITSLRKFFKQNNII